MTVPPGGSGGGVEEVLAALLTPEGLADPYAIYARLREEDREGGGHRRVLCRYEDVAAVLSLPELRSDRVAGLVRALPEAERSRFAPLEAQLGRIVAFTNPPDHTRLRRLLGAAFTPKVVRRERGIIERAVAGLLDRLEGRTEADLVAEVTFPLPALVVAGMLGIPGPDVGRFEGWARDLVYFVGAGRPSVALAERMLASLAEMREFVGALVARRRTSPGDDLLSAMVAATDAGDRLTADELFANALFLMTAGHETAANMIANGLVALLRSPGERTRLQSSPTLMASAVEELLRFDSAVALTARRCDRDRVLCGRPFAEGEAVVLLLGSANRDPERFADPDRLDLARPDARSHLTFARGIHVCLGARLAREEMAVAIGEVLRRLPGVELAGEVRWQPTLDFRGPTALPVAWSR